MKFKKLLGGGLLATVLALGVGAGLAVRSESKEADADVILSNIYYVGSDNEWADPSTHDMTGYQFAYAGSDGTSHYYTLTLNLTRDSKFAIRDWESGHESDWMKSYDGTLCLQNLKNEDNGDLRCLMTGNYTITYKWTNSSTRCISGFELNDANEMFYIADNTTWAQSSETLYLHAWTASGDITYWGYGGQLNKVASVKVSSNSYNFYRFKLPSSVQQFTIKHHNGDTDYKTGNLTPSDGSCYTSNSTADMGNAGAIIGNIYRNLGSYNYQGTTYENSICNINSTTRTNIINAYNKLTDNAKTIFDNSTLYTYGPVDLSTKTDVSFSTIVDKLKSNNAAGLARLTTLFDNNSTTPIALVVIISVVSLTAVGGYIFLERRKEN